jgi:hypothetical protein
MTKDNKHRIGHGPWTVVLWRDRQSAILTGLDRYPVIGLKWTAFVEFKRTRSAPWPRKSHSVEWPF